MNTIEILLDSSRGTYIPRDFAKEIGGDRFEGIDREDWLTIKRGPDDEWYWDAWNNILEHATFTDPDGRVWTLHHDGDLFLVCDEIMSDEQYEEFWGEPRD